MKNKIVMPIASLLLLLCVSTLKGAVDVGAQAPDFQLTDQFDKDFHLAAFTGQVVLLVCGDRVGSDYMGNWRKAVREKYKDQKELPLKMQSIANLSGIPGFMHGFVKSRFVEGSMKVNPPTSVLLDWRGDVARLYGFEEKLANVYLIDRAGVVRFKTAGKGSADETSRLLVEIDQLLKPATKS